MEGSRPDFSLSPSFNTVPTPVTFAPDMVGDVANTSTPVPVSLDITPASCADVVDANCESGAVVSASPPPAGAAHFTPRATVESATSDVPFAPTGNRAGTVLSPSTSPFVVSVAGVKSPTADTAAVPKPKLVRAVAALVRSDRLLAFCAEVDSTADAAPDTSNAPTADSAAVPKPKLVRAVAALVRSDRLLVR